MPDCWHTAHSTLRRRSLFVIAIYATLSAGWAGFAHWVVPPIIAAVYQGRSLGILNRIFEGRRPAGWHPVEYYFDRWSSFAGAILVAGVLHLAIVLIIVRVGRHKNHNRGSSLSTERAESRANVVLIVFSGVFLVLTVLTGRQVDYWSFLREWDAVLGGLDPWWNPFWLNAGLVIPLNVYGPLFNVLALLAWINELAPKLFFAFAYLVYVIWLIKDYGARRRPFALSWPVVIFWLLNPLPWVEIAYFGNFDVLVG